MLKSVIIIVFLVLCVCTSQIFAAPSYRISKGTTQCINSTGVEKNVTNACSYDIFLPVNTLAEWNTFISKAPSCVSFSACIPACALYKNKHTCAQCATISGTVVAIPAGNVCRINGSSCPSGWTRYPYYASCTYRSCSGGSPCDGLSYADSCSVNTAWGLQQSTECSCMYRWPGGGNPYHLPYAECANAWCTSSMIQVGCY